MCAKFVQDMLRAANYLHENNIIHRDIKPENYLLQNEDPPGVVNLKQVDFGLSKRMTEENKNQPKTRCGTPYYIAPEIMTGFYDSKVDVWAIGVCLYIMLTGKPPFTGQDTREVMRKIKVAKLDFGKAMI